MSSRSVTLLEVTSGTRRSSIRIPDSTQAATSDRRTQQLHLHDAAVVDERRQADRPPVFRLDVVPELPIRSLGGIDTRNVGSELNLTDRSRRQRDRRLAHMQSHKHAPQRQRREENQIDAGRVAP